MRVAGQASAATGRLMLELKAKGEEKGKDEFDKRLTVVKELKVGPFIVEIDGNGAVVASLAGRLSHGSSSGQMVSAADDPTWRNTCTIARGSRRERPATTKSDGIWEILPSIEHRQHRSLNNRAEHSHQPTRQRERRLQGSKSPGQAQRVLAAYGPIAQPFRPRRHRWPASAYRQEMRRRFGTWQDLTTLPTAA
jgi:hypothetical protein